MCSYYYYCIIIIIIIFLGVGAPTPFFFFLCVRVCVSVCVSERETERETARARQRATERERERERDRVREREREREREKYSFSRHCTFFFSSCAIRWRSKFCDCKLVSQIGRPEGGKKIPKFQRFCDYKLFTSKLVLRKDFFFWGSGKEFEDPNWSSWRKKNEDLNSAIENCSAKLVFLKGTKEQKIQRDCKWLQIRFNNLQICKFHQICSSREHDPARSDE